VTPIQSCANRDFLDQIAIIAGEPPWGSNLSADERLHLICLFYNLRGLAYYPDGERIHEESEAVKRALCSRGANEKAADLMAQRVAWERETSLITLVDDIATWPDLEQKGTS
jgi:hypothetical protein